MVRKTGITTWLVSLLGCLFLVLGGMVSGAKALPTIEISATGTSGSVLVSDSDGDGIVSWSGIIGDFNFAITAGVTKPQDGSAAIPMMHFTGMATTDETNATLTVKFSETDFGPMASGLNGFISSLNGAGGTQSLDVYYDTSNTLFGTGTQIADINTINTSQLFTGIPAVNPFSLTMVSKITLTDGTGSFDNTLNPVPEPATIMLMGVGLIGIGGVVRRRRVRKG